MKSFIALALVFAAQGAFALEGFNVVNVTQMGNLMPPTNLRGGVITTLTFKAESGGCTKAEDFKVTVKKTVKEQVLTIVRTRPDACEAMMSPVEIQVSVPGLNDSNNQEIRIANPALVQNNVTH